MPSSRSNLPRRVRLGVAVARDREVHWYRRATRYRVTANGALEVVLTYRPQEWAAVGHIARETDGSFVPEVCAEGMGWEIIEFKRKRSGGVRRGCVE